MADEENVSNTPDDSKLSKMRARVPKVDMDRVRTGAQKVVTLIKRFVILISVVFAAGSGFFLGARMHELGYTEGMMGKDLKGSSVKISGPCTVQGVPRIPALTEDDVKVTMVQDGKLLGIVRLTREVVECKLAEIAIDRLPLLADFSKTPAAVPALGPAQVIRREIPQLMLLENKVLLVSGVCRSQTGEPLPPFTDERMNVTNVDEASDIPGTFIISGIRRSDKVAMACPSRSVTYTVMSGNEPEPVVAAPITYVGKVLSVNSRCPPDPRVQPAPRGLDGRKISFFRLVNSPVQILEETFKDGKLVKFTGTIVDEKMKEAFGLQTVCDVAFNPMTYQLYDRDDINLDRIDSQKNNPTVTNGSQAITEEATPEPAAATPSTGGRVTPPMRRSAPPANLQETPAQAPTAEPTQNEQGE